MTPRVSVVMPVHNGAHYLRESIESVLAQTFHDFELVILDDGSTDPSAEIAHEYESDPRVRLEKRSSTGLTGALNAVCTLAHGELLARMDADDIALPDRLARQVAFLDAHAEVGLVGGAVVQIGIDGRRLGTATFPAEHTDIQRALGRRNCIAHATVVLRRALFEQLGGYRLDRAEDYDLWLRLAEITQLANLREPVLLYRHHPGQFSFENLDGQVLGGLAAVRAAELRAQTGVDPMTRDTKVDRDLVASLGVPDETIDAALIEGRLGWAVAMEAAGSPVAARSLLDDTQGAHDRQRFAVAFGLRTARAALGRRRPLRAARLAFAATSRHPLLTTTEVIRFLRQS